jgi:hypothetical protein
MRVTVGTVEISEAAAIALRQRETGSDANRPATREQVRAFLLKAMRDATAAISDKTPATSPESEERRVHRLARAVREAIDALDAGRAHDAWTALQDVAGICGREPKQLPGVGHYVAGAGCASGEGVPA